MEWFTRSRPRHVAIGQFPSLFTGKFFNLVEFLRKSYKNPPNKFFHTKKNMKMSPPKVSGYAALKTPSYYKSNKI